MNKKHVILSVFMIAPLLANQVDQPAPKEEIKANRPKAGLDQKTQAILARFATMLMSFFGILQNPNDSKNVADNVTTMLTGAVQIVAEAVKSGELSLDATDDEIRAYAETLAVDIEPSLQKSLVRRVNI